MQYYDPLNRYLNERLFYLDVAENSLTKFTIPQLLNFSIHVGRSVKNSLYLNSAFYYARTEKIFLINLTSTIIALKNGGKLAHSHAKNHAPVWYITNYSPIKNFITGLAIRATEFAYTNKWINGLLANYRAVMNYNRQLNVLIDKKVLSISKRRRFARIDELFWTFRTRIPGMVFFPDTFSSYNALEECPYVGVTSVAVIDTSTNRYSAAVPIPGNTFNFRSIFFISGCITANLMIGKLKVLQSISRIANSTNYFRRSIKPRFFFFSFIGNNYVYLRYLKYLDLIKYYPNLSPMTDPFKGIIKYNMQLYVGTYFSNLADIKRFDLRKIHTYE